MKKKFLRSTFLVALIFSSAIVFAQKTAEKTYKYETYSDDPMHTRIYTLDNGLTVYMSVYKNAPRIQTFITTKAGSKFDPHDATGLAHYLEHMLFKGTEHFGTKDYAKEKPLLDKIDTLFEVYRHTTDETKRTKIYHQIDSVSYLASGYAIANEYDKMMASIGGKGSNAFTSVEQTVFEDDIPSNQVAKWIDIEADRFSDPVMRLFHTELEAVYEEKNRNLDDDGEKSYEALCAGLYRKHPYGTQTTIGTIHDLKNPSLKKIIHYFHTYYVPNNMAICLSGDFDPDKTIRMIDEKFGSMKRKALPTFIPPVEDTISKPIVKNVVGPEAPNTMIGFRFGGANSADADMLMLVDKILYNSKAGLIDLNLVQQQKVLTASTYLEIRKDYSDEILTAEPKDGQTLEQATQLLLNQIENLKKGNFPDWLPQAVVENMKLDETKTEESNNARAMEYVSTFTQGVSWEKAVEQIDRISKITKQQIIDFANAHFSNNYVVVYKRVGVDSTIEKVTKPDITPVQVNREDESPFLKRIEAMPVKPIQPVFVDYKKDIVQTHIKNNVPLFYNENKENKTFDMYYVFDMGSNNDNRLNLVTSYLKYLGTSKLSSAEVQQEFYKLACTYNVYAAEDEIYVSLNGLTENFDKALQLFESLLNDPKSDKEALDNLVSDVLKERENQKKDKNTILFGALRSYGVYGAKSPFTNILSAQQLQQINPDTLTGIIKNLESYQHHILYYGSSSTEEITTALNKYHQMPATLRPVPKPAPFKELDNTNQVYVVNHDMKQAEIIILSKGGTYDEKLAPVISMFNEYFGGGMSSIVFQDLRESKALAYSVYSDYSSPKNKDKHYLMFSYIGSQADKLPQSMAGMTNLLDTLPKSPVEFNAAKDAILQKIRTERITRAQILFNYENAQKLGLDHDIRSDIFAKVPSLTLNDIENFQKNYVKGLKYTILVMGDKNALDLKALAKYGQVNFLTMKDIFGY
ncbi:MAG: insulinase family protein [Bacteroidia bacterium]